MSQTPRHHRDRILTTRHFTTALTPLQLLLAVDTALERHPGLDGLWSWTENHGAWAATARHAEIRLCGLELHGEMLLELRRGRRRADRWAVTVHAREGDLPALALLAQAIGTERLAPAARPAGGEDVLFDNIAQVMQSFQDSGPAGIVVTESAVESALACAYGDAPELIRGIKGLLDVRATIEAVALGLDRDRAASTRQIRLYLRLWPKAPVCLHRGEKVHLRHQLRLPAPGGKVLRVHFAYLAASRTHVVGWIDEAPDDPF